MVHCPLCVWCYYPLSLEKTWSCVSYCCESVVCSLRFSQSFKHPLLFPEHICKTIKFPNMSYKIFNCCSHSLFSWPEVGYMFYKRLVSCSVVFYEILLTNLSQAGFNCLEVHQKCTPPLHGHLCIPYYKFLPLCVGVLDLLCFKLPHWPENSVQQQKVYA